MTNTHPTQSQSRFSESIGALFDSTDKKKTLTLLKSPSDVGVMRNGGRNGARYAPQSFVSVLKKFTQDETTDSYRFQEVEVTTQELELQDFDEAQKLEAAEISKAIKQNERICHLGGGHDHIYPLLLALGESHRQVIVINVDAHADTRTDKEANSGTPFRQFDREGFHLFQIGLHSFSNSKSTREALTKGQMSTLWRKDLREPKQVDAFFAEIEKLITPDSVIVFSLDADAMDGAQVPGVSAVNPDGITFVELLDLWKRYEKLSSNRILGIYELNPVFDAPSMISMRRMAAFVVQTL